MKALTSLTLDIDLIKGVRERVGERGFSALVEELLRGWLRKEGGDSTKDEVLEEIKVLEAQIGEKQGKIDKFKEIEVKTAEMEEAEREERRRRVEEIRQRAFIKQKEQLQEMNPKIDVEGLTPDEVKLLLQKEIFKERERKQKENEV